MSIRTRLTTIVAILAAVTASILAYLAVTLADTRQRLVEAESALTEYERAATTGACIAALRVAILEYLAGGDESQRARCDELAQACGSAFERWLESSRFSLEVGIEDEAGDVALIEALSGRYGEGIALLRELVALRSAGDTGEGLFGKWRDLDAFFGEVLEENIEPITEDDIRELSRSLDDVLLSMGSTPWIARVGPAQLGTARATLSEIRFAHKARMRLLDQTHLISEFLECPGLDSAMSLVAATETLDVALKEWGRATENFARVSGVEPPPYYADFSEKNAVLQQRVADALDRVESGTAVAARDLLLGQLPPTLTGELLAAADSGVAAELAEFRDMLDRIRASTALAGQGGIAVMFLVLLSALALFLSTARGMLKALDQLRAGTERIGAGHLDHRLNLASTDELGRLGANFDAMAERLSEQVARRKSLEEELIRNERLATLGQVVATVSHEIRNPLGTIRTALYSLRKRTAGGDDALNKTLDRAERSVVRCDRIIEELLDYTRSRAPVRVKTPLDPWLSGVLDDFSVPPAIQVTRHLDSGATVHIDRDRMQGCVVNLLSNACQSMLEQDGGRGTGDLTVESRSDGGRVEVRITDTGPGIAPELLDKVFEPMFSTRTFGVGLGLPIVKRNMEQHGGGVQISSGPGRGTTAILWLDAMEWEGKTHETSPDTGGR